MPKRVVDGEGLWRSDKLGRVKPLSVRAEYANLLPLALANGVFEANPRRIWSQVYAYNRPDITLEKVELIVDALAKAGLLFRWTDGEGKVWGYWVGIDKPGRLPSTSRLRKRHEVVGPPPPVDELDKYVNSTNGSQRLASGCPGLGFGSGLGSGSGNGSGKEDAEAPAPPRFVFEGHHLQVAERQDKILGEAFPWVDRPEEYRKMDAWLEANPERRPRKVSRFTHSWFSRIPNPEQRRNHGPQTARQRQDSIVAAVLEAKRRGPLRVDS